MSWTWKINKKVVNNSHSARIDLTWPRRSLDLFVNSHLVVVGTELLDLQPFGGISAVFLSRVAGHALSPLISVGPAFSALESDRDPDALVLGHGRTCAA